LGYDMVVLCKGEGRPTPLVVVRPQSSSHSVVVGYSLIDGSKQFVWEPEFVFYRLSKIVSSSDDLENLIMLSGDRFLIADAMGNVQRTLAAPYAEFQARVTATNHVLESGSTLTVCLATTRWASSYMLCVFNSTDELLFQDIQVGGAKSLLVYSRAQNGRTQVEVLVGSRNQIWRYVFEDGK
ncbi:MAG: hypothetical protein V3U29_03660, partial [Phycisphaeraceae bacterium]